MTQAEKYDATLFNQFLSSELGKVRGKPSEIKACVGRALRRYAPGIDAVQLKDYIDSIYETIVTDDGGNLLEDWQQRVIAEHWS